MNHLSMLMAGLLGGGVAAAAVYLTMQTEAPVEVAPLVADGTGEGGDAGILAALERENRELSRRLDRVESDLEEARDSRWADAGEGPVATTMSPELRKEVLRLAGEKGRAEAAAAVKDELPTRVARESAKAETREGMLKRLQGELKSPDAAVRRKAIRGLRRIKGQEANAQIVAALKDADRAVRYEAARYFEDAWDDAALAPLTELLNAEDAEVGEQALDALNESNNEQALQELENYYLRGPNDELAYEAGKALKENDRAAVIPRGLQRFRDGTRSDSPNTRKIAVKGLRKFGTVADESLVRGLAEDPDPGVRKEVRKALKAWGIK